jgi:hypothetical protein
MGDRNEDSYSFGTDVSNNSGANSNFDDSGGWGTSRKDSYSQSGMKTFLINFLMDVMPYAALQSYLKLIILIAVTVQLRLGFSETFDESSFSEQYNGHSDETEDHDFGQGGYVTKKIEGHAVSSNLTVKEGVSELSISQQCGFVGLASFAQGMVIGSLFSVVGKAGSAFSTGKTTCFAMSSLHPLMAYFCDCFQVREIIPE